MKKAIMVIISILIILIICFLYWRNYESHQFTVEKWRSNPGERGRIVDNFLKKYDIYSMDKNSLSKLLGEPLPKSRYPTSIISIIEPKDNKISSEEWELDSENTVVYPFSSNITEYDESALYIKFGKNQRPVYYAIIYFAT